MNKEDRILERLEEIKIDIAVLKNDMVHVKRKQDNHLAHHDRYMYLVLGALVAAILSTVVVPLIGS